MSDEKRFQLVNLPERVVDEDLSDYERAVNVLDQARELLDLAHRDGPLIPIVILFGRDTTSLLHSDLDPPLILSGVLANIQVGLATGLAYHGRDDE